ncbi:membrane protein [Amylibacter ulvae]|uniref:Membrane protein n=1 Tax=Paramylibacter ulvae TaxID=1651968 RepID=A0ABQ3D3U3_9RHOB|nr:AzlD domain-containing protein [Amylibacter ulvae]GHA56406.1 membrane protein [Amylibacter ulvae]
MTLTQGTIWFIIIGLGLGTFLIRFSFLGIIGDRELPKWFLRHLNFVAVAVMPGLIAPMVVWPAATDGVLDAPRMLAALAAFAFGIWRKSVIAAVLAGFIVLYLALYLFG